MDTQTLPAEAPKEAQVLVLKLIDSKPSSFVMDGPGFEMDGSANNLDINAAISNPSYRWIRRVSRIKSFETAADGQKIMVYRKIRYINGCTFIDKERQDREGFKPNPIADLIVMRSGSLSVTREGDIGKFLYIQACEFNRDAPLRPDDAEAIFREIDTLVDAQAEESQFDLENEAIAVLSSLKKRTATKEFKYNEDQIEFLCQLFRIAPPTTGFTSEAWVALANVARNDPKNFLNSIANVKTLIETDVFSAVQLKAVIVDRDRAYFDDTKKVIMKFDQEASDEDKALQLVDFMSNPKNKNLYDQLRMQLKAKKNAMMQPQT